MTILGLHHITLVSSDAQRTTNFYVGVLGLRMIKQTVNFDDPSSYHIYFGDDDATPGSAITFFEWRDAPKGRDGIGGTHHFALTVADEVGLLKWKRRLNDLGVKVDGPHDRRYFKSIYFRDPDGVLIEIATKGPGWTVDEAADVLGLVHQTPPDDLLRAHRDSEAIARMTWDDLVPTITDDMKLAFGMHHLTAISSDIERTHDFFGNLLEMRRIKMTDNFDRPESAHWFWGVGEGKPGTLVTYLDWEKFPRARRARIGAGLTHHFALAVKDEEEQAQWRTRLNEAGYRVSPIMNRLYFRSIYTNDPDGHIVELATMGPGFKWDEDEQSLGTTLMLPPWLEQHRAVIAQNLTPLNIPQPYVVGESH